MKGGQVKRRQSGIGCGYIYMDCTGVASITWCEVILRKMAENGALRSTPENLLRNWKKVKFQSKGISIFDYTSFSCKDDGFWQ